MRGSGDGSGTVLRGAQLLLSVQMVRLSIPNSAGQSANVSEFVPAGSKIGLEVVPKPCGSYPGITDAVNVATGIGDPLA